ncbi:MAG: PAS domain-containing protein [Woeseiaceae bacterium]|nr:PAS domain-containing protein [Woeseiaceae bacterium]NIP20659.1 PAS domain-containing protein [Woeseiaceae bacterium]NIS89452.1 PAS domain-containing protein [Woeseiaceae bacterium]
MEHRRHPERFAGIEPGAAERASGASVLRRHTATGQQHELHDRGGLARSSQHPGRGSRRNGQADDSQPTEPVLCAAEHGEGHNGTVNRTPRSGDDGGALSRDPKRILDSLSSGVILVNESLLIVDLNPAAENILGISVQRARGKSLLRLVDDEPEMRDILARVLQTGDHYANELRLGPTEVHAEERIVDCRVAPIDIGSAALIIEMTDVTRRSKISRENALLIQHGAGRQMIRQLAHEIKNPLGGIRGAAQLLAKQLNDEELAEYTDVVISETDRLAGLVDTLLGPGGPPNKQPVNVHELLEYVVRLIEAEGVKHVKFERDYDPGLPLIDLDRDQIVQAFLNLVRNAVAALDGLGNIRLRSRAVTNFTIGDTRHSVIASIEIEDDGPGIPADMQDSVFYPLVTSRPEGTGLGLPAAQELLSRHGGLIEFESRPGRTVFFVRIPLNQAGTGS